MGSLDELKQQIMSVVPVQRVAPAEADDTPTPAAVLPEAATPPGLLGGLKSLWRR